MQISIIIIITFIIVMIVALIIFLIYYYFENENQRIKKFYSLSHIGPILESKMWDKIFEKSLYFHKYTRNHTHYFLSDDRGKLWYKLIDNEDNNTWKPLYWPGCLNGKTILRVSSDGRNLVVVDSTNRVYYRNIIIDKRVGNDSLNSITKSTQGYMFIDKLEKSHNWKPLSLMCSTLPFTRGWFTLKEHQSSCEISQRGIWNNFVTDKHGKRYLDKCGTTTLYYYDDKRECILLIDPFSPTILSISSKLPKTDTSFVSLAASASTILYVGKSKTNFVNENIIFHTWEIWYRNIDFDMKGMALHVRFYKDCETEWELLKKFYLPVEYNLGGVKLLNFGNNNKLMNIWFFNDQDDVVKYRIPVNKSFL